MTRKLTTTCDNCGQEISEDSQTAFEFYSWATDKHQDFCRRLCLWRYLNRTMMGEKDETQDIPFSDFVSTCTGGGEVCIHQGCCDNQPLKPRGYYGEEPIMSRG